LSAAHSLKQTPRVRGKLFKYKKSRAYFKAQRRKVFVRTDKSDRRYRGFWDSGRVWGKSGPGTFKETKNFNLSFVHCLSLCVAPSPSFPVSFAAVSHCCMYLGVAGTYAAIPCLIHRCCTRTAAVKILVARFSKMLRIYDFKVFFNV